MRLDRVLRTALVFAAACSTPSFAATHIITVGPGGSLTFSPATITIPPGDTITFQSGAGIAHNAVSDDNGATFNSGAPAAGPWTYETPPLAAGTYGFHCTVHGTAGNGMFGTITVQTTPVRLQNFGVD